MNNEDDLEPGLRRYFRAKAAELKAQAEQAIAQHGGLQGSHRENINKNYLKIILPARFSVGNGMIYDSYGNRSKEADIVLWDANNYPSLPMSGHSVLFAESVRVVLEVKSTWSLENFADIKEKCRKIAKLRLAAEPTQVDHISYMKEVIKSMMTGNPVLMYTLEPPRIGTAAIIFKGGEKFKAREILQEEIEEMDNAWPDILLLLSAGRVIIKRPRDRNRSPKNIRQYTGKYPSYTRTNWLEFITAENDALLIFTSALLELLRNRSTQTEAPFYLERYISQILRHFPLGYLETEYIIEFPVPPAYPGRPWNPV